MSIWPFANRATTKPKTRAPPPAPSQPNKPGAGGKNPSAPSGVRERPKRRTSRLQKTPSPPPGLRANTTSTSNAPASAAHDADADTKDASATLSPPAPPAAATAPLDPIAPASPMDLDFSARPRASTGGSAAQEKNITALPGSKALRTSPHLRPVTQDTADIPYNWNLRMTSHNSLPSQQNAHRQRRAKLQRNPSRNKRAAQYESPLARRRSSKKRRNDPLREEEIRAMSAPIDVPKMRGDNDLLRRESRKSRGPLNRNLERPTSTVSLPFEESIHSSMSGDAEQRNYRLSVLDVMSPRPAIRFRDMTKTYANDNASSNLLRKASRTERPSGKATVQVWRPTKEEEKARERARIDSLADEMDSTELRDILERDRKRKEKKRDRDAERLKRKLERRVEKQRTKEWLAQQEAEKEAGKEAEKDLGSPETPVAHALGIAGVTETETQDVRVSGDADFHMEDVEATAEDPFVEKEREEGQALYQDPEKTPMPLEDIHPAFRAQYQAATLGTPSRAAGGEVEPQHDMATPMSDIQTPMDTPALDTAQAVSYTAARPITPLSPVTSSVYHGDRIKASKILGTDVAGGNYTVSNTVLHEATRPKESQLLNKQPGVARREEHARKDSDVTLSASKKKPGFLASLFRGSRRSVSETPRQAPPLEPSFQNTSREEMSRNIPSHLVHQPSSSTSFKKSGIPLRTTSIFREDLPESPISPPDSRLHSPVDKFMSSRGVGARRAQIPSAIMSEGYSRVDSPEGDGISAPISPHSARASGLMSQSMASVDSEASWLSGKSPRSASRAHKRGSLSGGSLGRRDDFQGSYEELGIPEDEYFRRLNTPLRGSEPRASNLSVAIAGSQHASSTALRSPGLPPKADAGMQEGHVVSHAGAGRQPVVVHYDSRHKSSEGLLNNYLSSSSLGRPGTADTAAAAAPLEDTDKTPEREYPTPAETPTDERSSEEATPVQRATSVNVGKGHARNVSAGSAKLLDITRRGSASLSASPIPPATPQRSQNNLAREGSSPLTAEES